MQGNKCCSFFNRRSDPTKITEAFSLIKITTCNAKKSLLLQCIDSNLKETCLIMP